ncbi:hypothetical protein [Ligilactobacillus ruminis]|uniref:hypothetical protein n=1 Tax=Ligilactobacillus ruminis TaxID=1623 RepID=UPI0015F2F128|nr:hypothetical protein [Ligilactobacillus ruminis]
MITYFFIFGSNNYLRQQISFNQKRPVKNHASSQKKMICICLTSTCHDGNIRKQFGGKFAGWLDLLLEQAMHLAKPLPFTDTSMKMDALSVIGLLEKRRLRTKWAKTAVCP